MEIPNNPTPHIHYKAVEPVGTAAKPTLTDYTYGAEEDYIFFLHFFVIFFCSIFLVYFFVVYFFLNIFKSQTKKSQAIILCGRFSPPLAAPYLFPIYSL